jgi:hypothetical protein
MAPFKMNTVKIVASNLEVPKKNGINLEDLEVHVLIFEERIEKEELNP